MSERWLPVLVAELKKQPMSQAEFRKKYELPQSTVCETFGEAWVLGLIERINQTSRRSRGPGSPRYAVVGA